MKMKSPYIEAMRYIENAKEDLKHSKIEDKFFTDQKYVQSACGIAYVGILKALDSLFEFKNVPKKKGRKSIEYYKENLSKIDKRLLNHLNEAYHILHLDGYYGGVRKVKTIESGFDSAITIIDSLKDYSKVN